MTDHDPEGARVYTPIWKANLFFEPWPRTIIVNKYVLIIISDLLLFLGSHLFPKMSPKCSQKYSQMFPKNGNRYSVPYLNQRLAYFCQFLYNNLTILIWPLWRAYTKLKIKSSYQVSLVKFNFLNWAFFCIQNNYIFIWFSRKLWINIRKSLIPLRSPEIISTPICPIR